MQLHRTVRPTILHAPSPLGLRPPRPGRIPGTRRMPEALRAAGLHEALGADYACVVLPPRYEPRRHRRLGVLNPRAVESYSRSLADRIGELLDDGRFPLVLGGDCSVLLGCALALRRRGDFGLAFLDGHADLLTPDTSRTGGVAGMDLAIVTGTGPDLLADIEGRRPYVREPVAVQLGSRDFGPADLDAGRAPGTGIRMLTLEEIRRAGPAAAAQAALARLERASDGVWIHLDADVLDDVLMPAVDSRQPDGLSVGELVELLRRLVSSSRVVGMNATIYDPDLDPTGAHARTFASVIVAGLAGDGDVNSGGAPRATERRTP